MSCLEYLSNTKKNQLLFVIIAKKIQCLFMMKRSMKQKSTLKNLVVIFPPEKVPCQTYEKTSFSKLKKT